MIDIFQNREIIDNFIQAVFNYYNGVINVFNYPAKLIIDWAARYDSDVGGSTRNPNIVYIYPMVTYRHTIKSDYWYFYNLLVSIIHELHHIDQVICYPKLYNVNYQTHIENCVELETYLYIANHQKEIEDKFGIVDTVPYNKYHLAYEMFEDGYMYQRKTYQTHLISILQDILYMERCDVIDTFANLLYDPYARITMHINDKALMLKSGNNACPLDILNDTFEQEFFRFAIREATTALNKVEDDLFDLHIRCSGSNVMCYKRRMQ